MLCPTPGRRGRWSVMLRPAPGRHDRRTAMFCPAAGRHVHQRVLSWPSCLLSLETPRAQRQGQPPCLKRRWRLLGAGLRELNALGQVKTHSGCLHRRGQELGVWCGGDSLLVRPRGAGRERRDGDLRIDGELLLMSSLSAAGEVVTRSGRRHPRSGDLRVCCVAESSSWHHRCRGRVCVVPLEQSICRDGHVVTLTVPSLLPAPGHERGSGADVTPSGHSFCDGHGARRRRRPGDAGTWVLVAVALGIHAACVRR